MSTSISRKLGAKKLKEWDSSNVDPNKYKLTEKEILRKKQLLVSKHNILTNSTVKSLKPKKIKKFEKSVVKNDSNDFSALDILENASAHSMESSPQSNILLVNQKEKKKTKIVPTTPHNITSTPSDKTTATKQSNNINKPFSMLSPTPSTTKKYSNDVKKVTSNSNILLRNCDDSDESDDFIEIYQQIISLQKELRYYEEIAGIKSGFDSEELSKMIPLNKNDLDVKVIMRYLVQLICQSMSYLLKSEIDKAKQQNLLELLSNKVENLSNNFQVEKNEGSAPNNNIIKQAFKDRVGSLEKEDIVHKEMNDLSSHIYSGHLGTSSTDWLLAYTTSQFDKSNQTPDKHIRRHIDEVSSAIQSPQISSTIRNTPKSLLYANAQLNSEVSKANIYSQFDTVNSTKSQNVTPNLNHDEDALNIYNYLLNTDYMTNITSASITSKDSVNFQNEYVNRLSAVNINSPIAHNNYDESKMKSSRIILPTPTQLPKHPFVK